MADISIYAGSTSQSIDVFIADSSSTTGQGLSGLAYDTTTFKDSVYYRKAATGSPVKITLATLANAQAAWSSGGFVQIDATNMKGWYRLDVPDAMISSSGFVHLFIGAGTNVAPVCMRVNCSALPVDLKSWLGTAPNSLNNGRVEAIDWIIRTGTAQAGGTASITLDSGASAVANAYRWMRVMIVSGTGAGQCETATLYDGTSKELTVSKAWIVQPDNTSVFVILPALGDVIVSLGTSLGQMQISNGIVQSDLRTILGSALTGTAALISASFSAMYNVVSPVFTTAAVNQTGDSYAIVNHGANGNAAIKTAVDTVGTAVDAVPTAAEIATTLFVDGSTNKLKVNTDNSVNVDTDAIADAVVAAVGDGITLVSPLSTDGGTLTFTQGDDLYTADGKAPIWTLTGTLPSWVGATGELRLTSGGITKTITITDAQIQDTGSTRTITAEIPRATTGSLPEDPAGSFQVMVQLASGHQFTEVKNGVLVVQRRIA